MTGPFLKQRSHSEDRQVFQKVPVRIVVMHSKVPSSEVVQASFQPVGNFVQEKSLTTISIPFKKIVRATYSQRKRRPGGRPINGVNSHLLTLAIIYLFPSGSRLLP